MRSWLVVFPYVLAIVAFGCAPGAPRIEGGLSHEDVVERELEASRPVATAPAGSTTLDALPWDERMGLERAMAAEDPRHAPSTEDGRPALESRGVSASFARGAELHVGEHTATLRAVSLGRGDARTELADVAPRIEGPEVRAERAPGVIEWWRSLSGGLEHGVTIAKRPAGRGELTLALAVTGLRPQNVSDESVEFVDSSGGVVATYAHLLVTDARGARIPAHMLAGEGAITIAVDDDEAVYPLVIDPLVAAHEADLLDARFTNDRFGTSIALSSDGSRALVGAPATDVTAASLVAAGSARVFVRTGARWAEEALLLPSGLSLSDAFGCAVALSGDGTRALVGASRDETAGGRAAGSARVFLRTGTSWTEEVLLSASDGAESDRFGFSVALNTDGSRALVGVLSDDTSAGVDSGSVRVFVRTGTSWAEEATLLAPDTAAGDQLGYAVSLSGDSSRALAGAPGDTIGTRTLAGSSRVFVRAGAVWSHEATLSAPDFATNDRFGMSNALSTDGTRALVGVPSDDTTGGADAGSARVFVRTGVSWVQETTLLAIGGSTLDRLGWVSLSGDGSRAIVGADRDDTVGGTNAGTARVFSRTGTSWTEEALLLAPDGATDDGFGWASALSADGSRALIGAISDDAPSIDSGSVRVFVRGASWTEEARLFTSNGTAQSDSFGFSVALSADGARALVGACYDDTPGGVNAGSARVFARAGASWTEETTLLAADGMLDDSLGWAVALSADGSRALVGAPLDDVAGVIDAGSARVFVRTGTTWIEETTLFAADGAESDQFGTSVSLSADGSRALIGVFNDDTTGGMDAGSARVFVRTGTTWIEEARLLAGDGAADDQFGVAVAVSADGSRALIGAVGDDTIRGSSGGSARVFVRTGTVWAEEATLLTPDGAAFDRIGFAVALSSDGTRALLGIPRDIVGGVSGNGSARIFLRMGTLWTQEATLLPADGLPNDFFGWSVALSDDGSRAIIGSPFDDTPGGSDAGSSRVFLRTGTAWTLDATLLAPQGARDDTFGRSVALSADGSRALVGVNADDTAGGLDTGNAHVFTVQATRGSGCAVGAACVSGNCVDGVCCDTACGGGAVDCQACSVTAGGGVDGTCGPLRPSEALTVTCRAGTDGCDAPEVCSPSSTTCPADALHPMGFTCRGVAAGAAGGCDVAETCDGVSAACPADLIRPTDSLCRAAAGDCDRLERCDGVSPTCPTDLLVAASTVCRMSAGGCDVAETCDGATAACPGDDVLPAGSVCGVGMGTCAMPSVCDGASFLCSSPGGVRPAGTVCRTAASLCDVEDACDGTSEMCVDAFRPATTECGSAPSGACDAQDFCTGTSGDCMPTFLAGVECRGSTGACDPADLCTGGEAECPPDQFSPSGTVCRDSTESCDPSESCDGVVATCPADENACMPRPDVGPVDASGTDAGIPPAPVEGCRCRVAAGAPVPVVHLGLVLAVLALVSRRRR
jgi:hypothetical protein